MTTYVYMILNTINGKMYIGQSCSKYRWQEHIYTSENPEYDKHRLIHRAMSKHGVSNFEFRVIQSFNKTEDALEAGHTFN
jgi:group I intron endonuclease